VEVVFKIYFYYSKYLFCFNLTPDPSPKERGVDRKRHFKFIVLLYFPLSFGEGIKG